MIPADDRGFTLGDGLFETVLAKAGRLMLWERHVDRMARGCAALGLPAPTADALETAAQDALKAADLATERAAVRLTWSAGSGGRGLDRPEPTLPRLIASAAPSPAGSAPLRLITSTIRRNPTSPTSRLKTLSYLDPVEARRQARAAGADEAVMLSTGGLVASASAANLFWIAGASVFSPALDCGVLEGTIRGLLIERLGAQEIAAGPEALAEAEALFVTNSLMGVRAAASLDGRALGDHPLIQKARDLAADYT